MAISRDFMVFHLIFYSFKVSRDKPGDAVKRVSAPGLEDREEYCGSHQSPGNREYYRHIVISFLVWCIILYINV
ncbi:MAG: hypothetical protein BWY93_02248 [Euryarchaeota archaeon ADurb.BinA087]|nr:MAG: hypothetical protein BWY93_02248 [Euryarchaeota archaeon ADurb.BinA087]